MIRAVFIQHHRAAGRVLEYVLELRVSHLKRPDALANSPGYVVQSQRKGGRLRSSPRRDALRRLAFAERPQRACGSPQRSDGRRGYRPRYRGRDGPGHGRRPDQDRGGVSNRRPSAHRPRLNYHKSRRHRARRGQRRRRRHNPAHLEAHPRLAAFMVDCAKLLPTTFPAATPVLEYYRPRPAGRSRPAENRVPEFSLQWASCGACGLPF